jgi:small multidrug resistance family-3 protein
MLRVSDLVSFGKVGVVDIPPGVVSLVLFAWLLTRIESIFAGRVYAAYGCVYVAVSLLWLW